MPSIETHTARCDFRGSNDAIRAGRQRGRHRLRDARSFRAALGARSIVLVGMPGCGKSAIGRRLAPRLDLPFVDADEEIEQAAGKSIKEIFADHGEAYFRDGERKVIARLLPPGPQVLATGGGALMVEETRANIRRSGISIWVKAELPLLVRRVLEEATIVRCSRAATRRPSMKELMAIALSRSIATPTSSWRAGTCRTRRSSARR